MNAHVSNADLAPRLEDLEGSATDALRPARGIGLGLLLGAASWALALFLVL